MITVTEIERVRSNEDAYVTADARFKARKQRQCREALERAVAAARATTAWDGEEGTDAPS